MFDNSWTDEQLNSLLELLEDDRPLFLFIDEKDNVIDSNWFASAEEAMQHARTLPFDTVHICIHIGCAENIEERFDLWVAG